MNPFATYPAWVPNQAANPWSVERGFPHLLVAVFSCGSPILSQGASHSSGPTIFGSSSANRLATSDGWVEVGIQTGSLGRLPRPMNIVCAEESMADKRVERHIRTAGEGWTHAPQQRP